MCYTWYTARTHRLKVCVFAVPAQWVVFLTTLIEIRHMYDDALYEAHFVAPNSENK